MTKLGAVLAAGVVFAHAATLKLEPVADTCVSRWDQDKNFGSPETLELYGSLYCVLI